MKPESFPFLRIAKKYGYDYADVLAYADLLRKYGNSYVRFPHEVAIVSRWSRRAIAAREVIDAAQIQKHIRDGILDWQTGEYRSIFAKD